MEQTYQDLARENNYLKNCLSLDTFVYAVCVGITDTEITPLGCVKFLNGVDHWRSRDKMFANIGCKKYWILVEEEVYATFKKGKYSFFVS